MNRPGQVKCVPLRVGIHAARAQRSGEGRSVGRPPREDSRRQPPLWLPALLPTPIPAAARPWGQSVFQGELDPSPLPPLQGREKDHRDELPSLGLDKPEWQSAAASTSLVWSPGSGRVWGAGVELAWLVGSPGTRPLCQACLGPERPLLTLGSPREGPTHPHFPPGAGGQAELGEPGALGPCARAAAGTACSAQMCPVSVGRAPRGWLGSAPALGPHKGRKGVSTVTRELGYIPEWRVLGGTGRGRVSLTPPE